MSKFFTEQLAPLTSSLFLKFSSASEKPFLNFMEIQILLDLTCSLYNSIYAAVNVYVPKDRVTNAHQGYGFVEFRSEEDADYVSVGCLSCYANFTH